MKEGWRKDEGRMKDERWWEDEGRMKNKDEEWRIKDFMIYSHGEKSVVFLVSRSFTQNTTDFSPPTTVSENLNIIHVVILIISLDECNFWSGTILRWTDFDDIFEYLMIASKW